MHSNSVLILGLFINEKNKGKVLRTASDQLAELLRKYKYSVITASFYQNRYIRILDSCFTILANANKYNVAIVPFYSGYRSLVLEWTLMNLLKLLNKKQIVVMHGGNLPNRMKLKPHIYVPLLKKANVLLAPSPFLLHEVKKYELDVSAMENVINLSNYHFQQKSSIQPKLLWMRTFEDIYNPCMAIDVLHLLLPIYPNATLVMGGKDEGMLQVVMDYAKQLQIEKQVQFVGYIDMAAKNKLAAECDMYLCTNNIDNAPVSVIEMMALGLLVVSTNAGGLSYLIQHRQTGLLVDCNDAKSMASYIDYYIKNKEEALKIILLAKENTIKYGEDIVFAKWKQLLEKYNVKPIA